MEPFLLNKAFVSADPEYTWLSNRMDDSFEIKLKDKSVVVCGYNGIGKTSFARCIKKKSSLNFRFLDYENDVLGETTAKIVIAPRALYERR